MKKISPVVRYYQDSFCILRQLAVPNTDLIFTKSGKPVSSV